MTQIRTTQAEAVEVLSRLDESGKTQRELAAELGLTENKISKIRSGERQMKAGEVIAALKWLEVAEATKSAVVANAEFLNHASTSYLSVEVLPSFAGMGGGGTGEGDASTALLPRSLIEDELRARPEDLLLIEARGESMQPDFCHGDQILIDRRDNNPIQPGAFALWDGDGYVVKLVERVARQKGRYRIFSSNQRFSAYEVDEHEIKIMGRPVWFGRRL